MKAAPFLPFAPVAFAAGAEADTPNLDLPGTADRMRVAHKCSDGIRREVDDMNLPDNDLALVTAGSSRRLFGDVIAASGAKDAAGAQIRWSKGREASLLDVTNGDSSIAECQQIQGRANG